MFFKSLGLQGFYGARGEGVEGGPAMSLRRDCGTFCQLLAPSVPCGFAL